MNVFDSSSMERDVRAKIIDEGEEAGHRASTAMRVEADLLAEMRTLQPALDRDTKDGRISRAALQHIALQALKLLEESDHEDVKVRVHSILEAAAKAQGAPK